MEHFYCYGEVRAPGLRDHLYSLGYVQPHTLRTMQVSSPGAKRRRVLLTSSEEPTGFYLADGDTLHGLSEEDGEAYAAPGFKLLLAAMVHQVTAKLTTSGRLHVYHEYGEQEFSIHYEFLRGLGWVEYASIEIAKPVGEVASTGDVLNDAHARIADAAFYGVNLSNWQGIQPERAYAQMDVAPVGIVHQEIHNLGEAMAAERRKRDALESRYYAVLGAIREYASALAERDAGEAEWDSTRLGNAESVLVEIVGG